MRESLVNPNSGLRASQSFNMPPQNQPQYLKPVHKSNITGDSTIEKRIEEFKMTLQQARQNTDNLLLPETAEADVVARGRSVGT